MSLTVFWEYRNYSMCGRDVGRVYVVEIKKLKNVEDTNNGEPAAW